MSDTDKYEGLIDAEGYIDYDGIDILLSEVKQLREILGDIIAIDEWGGDGKDVGITITFSEGDSFMGWLSKCDDEVKRND
tara:strand:+ start:214 stop:453 length:240 start_codon:yes stop_codon:yes gene_type:complete